MARTLYEQGRNKEYSVMKKLRRDGYYAIRSAGSHGLFDVIAIDHEKKEILLIQVKASNMLLKDGSPNKELKEIIETLGIFDGKYDVKTEVR